MRHAIHKLLHWIRSGLGRPISSIIYTSLFAFLVGLILGIILLSAALLNVPLATTLVKIDLLQAFAFLLAWSAFLLTITYRMVHDSRDTNERFEEVKRVLRENSLTDEERIAQVQAIALDSGRLREENEQLRRENEEIRRTT